MRTRILNPMKLTRNKMKDLSIKYHSWEVVDEKGVTHTFVDDMEAVQLYRDLVDKQLKESDPEDFYVMIKLYGIN